MTSLLLRLLVDDEGQDLVEYVLLTTVVGLAIIVAINVLSNAMLLTYQSWDGGMQALSQPQDPQ
jgi:Flp pilus assembly pilin Flp